MNHRPTSAIVLVVVVVLAGCSGGIPFTGDGSSANGTTAQPAAATQTGGGSNSVSFPPGYSTSGITNPKRALKHHASALFSHDSFMFTSKGPVLSTGRLVLVARVNIAEKRMYVISNISEVRHPSRTEEYLTGNTSYVAEFFGGIPPSFRVTTEPFMPYVTGIFGVKIINSITLLEIVRNVRFGGATRVTRDNETFLRYESTKIIDEKALLPVLATNATVNEFNATVLVDEEGIIRLVTYTISHTTSSGEQTTISRMARISRIDATTVEKPNWLDEAKAQTNPSSTETTNGTG